MTRRKGEEAKVKMRALADVMLRDIAEATDDEILVQFNEDVGSPDENAVRMRALFEQTVLVANKSRLLAARTAVVTTQVTNKNVLLPVGEARARLRQVLDAHSNDETFTLAARKESELSDSDVLDLLEVIRELGLLE